MKKSSDQAPDGLPFKFRLFPKKVELQALHKYYDIDRDGNVSYEEFISGLR
jgi:Ca2+-binding EF-hand superfamily protein